MLEKQPLNLTDNEAWQKFTIQEDNLKAITLLFHEIILVLMVAVLKLLGIVIALDIRLVETKTIPDVMFTVRITLSFSISHELTIPIFSSYLNFQNKHFIPFQYVLTQHF